MTRFAVNGTNDPGTGEAGAAGDGCVAGAGPADRPAVAVAEGRTGATEVAARRALAEDSTPARARGPLNRSTAGNGGSALGADGFGSAAVVGSAALTGSAAATGCTAVPGTAVRIGVAAGMDPAEETAGDAHSAAITTTARRRQ
jgi:hypothetical protein